jgi:putative flavoprotein involved in K+ transport
MIEKIDTVVVGAGQAGLAMSYHLKQSGREHVIVERGRAAQSWLERALGLVDVPVSQFVYPTTRVLVRDRRPGWLRSEIRDRSLHRAECSSDRRPVALQLPGRGAAIERCIRPPSTRHRARNDRSKACRRCDRPVPNPAYSGFGASLPVDIFQVHSRDYRNPRQLPSGAVLVVRSGASGCQIAEELHQAGRKVFLSVGQFHKTPRRYRGRDIYWWFEVLGIWHRPLELQPEVRNLRHPLSTFRQASRSWLVTQYWVSQYFGSLDVVPHDYRSRQSEPLPL